MNLWTSKYSKTYVIGNRYYGPNHGGMNEGKIRKRPFKSGNFIDGVKYLWDIVLIFPLIKADVSEFVNDCDG